LRGLAALFGKINALLSEPAGAATATESLDLFGLSRFLQRRGEDDRANSACAQALSIGLPAEFRPRARRELALMAKRRGEHARAAEIWLEIVDDPHDGIHACEQLAIYYERHAKDLAKAAQFAKSAVATLRRQCANSRDPFLTARSARLEKKFLQRVARLEKKSRPSSLARPQGARVVAEPKANSGLW
jgi:lipopolysaccharide biosynthesis regulator YciM